MKQMRFPLLPLAFLLASVVPSQAAKFDNSKPFLCATIDIESCAPNENCQRETALSANVPEFFLVDLDKKTVTNAAVDGTARTSAIEHVERIPPLLVLGGNDGATAWIAAITETGKMSVSAVGDHVGFVVFGSCVNP